MSATAKGKVEHAALTPVTLAGEAFLLDPAGVALHPESGSLVVADLHLEKASHFAAYGQMLPPYETRDTLRRLTTLVKAHAPRRIICLGDSFHHKNSRLAPDAAPLIAELAAGRQLIWIPGNHDPAPPPGVPGEAVEGFALGKVQLRHEPVEGGVHEMVGHLHPALRLRGGRRKCFLLSEQRLVLPAFGSLTGSLDAEDPAIARWFSGVKAQAFLLGAGRLYPVPLSL